MKLKPLFNLAVTFGILFSLNSCKSSEELKLPFTDEEYLSDKDNFRSKQTGKSPDLATAKKIALQNAKSEIAGNIQSTIKRVTDQYTNQRTVGNKVEFENKFEEQTRDVVLQTLTDIKIIGEKAIKETDDTYTYWIVIEVSKSSVLEGINNKISKVENLKLDYDKKKFEETFNKEMEKLESEK